MAMQDIMFELPPVEGLGLDPATTAAFESFGAAVQRAFEELNGRAQDPASIILETPDGPKTLLDLGYSMPRRGTIRAFHISWGAAMNMRGWLICDGKNGTPHIHPHPKDLTPAQRFIRASAWGKSSGTTGGSTYHVHDDHTVDDVAAALADHAKHLHYFSTQSGESPDYDCVDCGCDISVSINTHTHNVSGNTNLNAAAQAHEGNEGNNLEHSLADHTPPYCDVIFMMKE